MGIRRPVPVFDTKGNRKSIASALYISGLLVLGETRTGEKDDPLRKEKKKKGNEKNTQEKLRRVTLSVIILGKDQIMLPLYYMIVSM